VTDGKKEVEISHEADVEKNDSVHTDDLKGYCDDRDVEEVIGDQGNIFYFFDPMKTWVGDHLVNERKKADQIHFHCVYNVLFSLVTPHVSVFLKGCHLDVSAHSRDVSLLEIAPDLEISDPFLEIVNGLIDFYHYNLDLFVDLEMSFSFSGLEIEIFFFHHEQATLFSFLDLRRKRQRKDLLDEERMKNEDSKRQAVDNLHIGKVNKEEDRVVDIKMDLGMSAEQERSQGVVGKVDMRVGRDLRVFPYLEGTFESYRDC